MNNPFTRHPHSIGETYLEHMKIALSTSIKIQLVVLTIVVHAILPFLFEHTGSDELNKINKELQGRKNNAN